VAVEFSRERSEREVYARCIRGDDVRGLYEECIGVVTGLYGGLVKGCVSV
jgi:hypothetical protein